ncbi:MAG: phosphoribosylformylglycinamidine synthase [Nitrospirae bacterium GWC2_57_13]|nr:MAG: phosphoribosylformylglycinamidine synthase [Nitrospirae bacterium GWC2_57_13]
MNILHFFRTPALSNFQVANLLQAAQLTACRQIKAIETEFCYNIAATSSLSQDEMGLLRWLLAETFEPAKFSDKSFLNPPAPPSKTPLTPAPLPNGEREKGRGGFVIRGSGGDSSLTPNSALRTPNLILEVGPRMSFTTAWSTNAVSVCRACGLDKITRVERSRRYFLTLDDPAAMTPQRREAFLSLVHDRMTECLYPAPLTTFDPGVVPEPVRIVPLMEEGRPALERINREMGLGMDDWDLDYYTNLFVKDIGRNPTNVECFDLSQSNSEHSRHWFFRGRLVVGGKEVPDTLMKIVKATWEANKNNSVIAFSDNSSAIRGYDIATITPKEPGKPSPFVETRRTSHIIFTAETHNFPSGVAPFPGAETGTGGRIRDVQATGTGGHVIAGTAAYCVGNLQIPGYVLPWEDPSYAYPTNLAPPLRIEVEASNGASDYGNKFGEPLIQGFTRSFGLRLPDGERREWLKPIMFSGGIGQMDAQHTTKAEPEKGMLVVKVGGPAYRIGMGGGAASSMIQGENVAELDFNAVQRGDAEMEQKMNRVIRACIELGNKNPIASIHDQGAGGNCNVVKEIIHPAGGKIEIRKVPVGDATLSVLEIWGAEYQEQNALLIKAEHADLFTSLCEREKVSAAFIGTVTGDGFIVLHDAIDGSTPVNLELAKVLGEMPQKTFTLDRTPRLLNPLKLPKDLTVFQALERVLRLLSVGSKRFLVNKVDRSVTGLIAQQQCCGPLHLTVADVAVIAQSHFGLRGAATAIGEQPVKELIDPASMARMSVGEALTNIVWAQVSGIEDIRCSANWMWAPKLPGEGARLYDAAVAMRDMMIELGIAVDGGKDSLSMAAKVTGPGNASEIVKSPGTLVISAYVTCPDVTKTVTPDLKAPGKGLLLYIDLAGGRDRLGGSALAQTFSQVGHESPDVEVADLLKRAFIAVQKLLSEGSILAGHDRSDGGLITTLLEMAFAGNCGIDIKLQGKSGVMPSLFSEELGFVIEYLPEQEKRVLGVLDEAAVPYERIGKSIVKKQVTVKVNNSTVLDDDLCKLRDIWEETSFSLDLMQRNPDNIREERKNSFDRSGPKYLIAFASEETSQECLCSMKKPKVAVIREEGSNGDREMVSAFAMAGFEPWDVMMTDLLSGRVTLDQFRGVVFVGGFSYADVLDSAKGWAATIRFNRKLWEQFERFYNRPDTFSLGVCNGCQLMALLGWVPWRGISDELQPRFIHNASGRFESRFSTVRILPGPAVMLKGMEGSVLGIWVAHGEGMAYFPDRGIFNETEYGLAPIRYVDDKGKTTESYPFNPNGSPAGIAALCSPDGRHLAMMPHPERTVLTWQWPWLPENLRANQTVSPWLRMFQNAREWCEKSRA